MGKVAWGFTCSIDGFIAGPGHDMGWLAAGEPVADGLTERLAGAVSVIIAGRAGYDAARAQRDERNEMTSKAYGGAWSGTEFILTHRPHEIADDPSIVALDCGIVEAVERARALAGDGDIQIISADIARQALDHDLIDELQVFVAPVFLGDGTRIFDVPGGRRYDWELVQTYEGAERSFGRTYRPKRDRSS
jgi:dihydrofolate reductase